LTDYDTDDDFVWDGNESGYASGDPPCNLTNHVAPYTVHSCSHICVVGASSSVVSAAKLHTISLSDLLSKILLRLLPPIVAPSSTGRVTVADTGATDHMVSDKMCFVSYCSISGLTVQMGNNTYILVPGRGTAIFLLGGNCILLPCPVLQCRFTASALTFVSRAVASLAQTHQVSWLIFQLFFFRWTHWLIVISHTSRSVGQLH
jgi:hypothetical protein